jgi:hypothetical protein
MRHSAPSASRPHRSHRAAAVRPAASAGGQAPATDQASAAGGSRRAGAAGRWWRQLPYAIVLCCLALVLLWMQRSEQHVRGGTLAVAGLLFATALARLTLPERQAGMLASRRRLTDVAVLTALGAGLLVAGLLLPVQP